jgi:hypothetical protein
MDRWIEHAEIALVRSFVLGWNMRGISFAVCSLSASIYACSSALSWMATASISARSVAVTALEHNSLMRWSGLGDTTHFRKFNRLVRYSTYCMNLIY